ncbi:Hypothetical predicted protein [Octopus vulgaris]|uniref:Thioredoxin domain-containing protein n=2 Tax=Octopus vulgaris TaxID=6645 RepID=A0AA36AER0_OCTVU|nr:Hypothetical predicted protein [Octopus vulgaris]
MFLALITILAFAGRINGEEEFSFRRVTLVSDAEKFKAADGFKMIYHIVNSVIPTYERKEDFFEMFEHSADVLRNYDFKVGLIDCSTVKDIECNEPKVNSKVFLYNGDEIWADVPLANMLDVDSVVSNALLIPLLDDFEIIYTRIERLEVVAQLQGFKNVIFGYLFAIGTNVHRVLLELAYIYKQEIQFMLTTTQRTISDLEQHSKDNSTMIWFFLCKDSSDTEPFGVCPTVLYRGNISFTSLASAIKLVNGPKYYYLPENGSSIPCNVSNCLYLFHSKENKADVENVAESVVTTYLGVVAVILVDMDSKNLNSYLYYTKKTPSAAISFAGQNGKTFMETSFSKVSLMNFLQRYVAGSVVKQEPLIEEQEALEEFAYSINDDEVSNVVYSNRDVEYDNIVTTLTDQSFADLEQSSQLTLVIFYLPYNPVYSALLQHFLEWKQKYGSLYPHLSVACFNCFDWTDVCEKQHILHTPTLQLFGQKQGLSTSKTAINYTGALHATDIMAFLYLHHFNETVHLKEADIPSLLSGQFQSIANITSHCLLGLFSEDSEELKNFSRAAKEKRGTSLFTFLTGDAAKKFAKKNGVSIPSVMAIRWSDLLQPINYLSPPITPETVSQFAEASKVEKFGELTPEILPYIHRLGKPLSIFFWKPSDTCESAFAEVKRVSQSVKSQDIVFTWLNLASQMSDHFQIQLFETYFQAPVVPALSMVYFSEHAVYNYEDGNFSEESVLEWMEKLREKRHEMKSSYDMEYNDWKPTLRSINFLKDHPFMPLKETTTTSTPMAGNEKKESASHPHQSTDIRRQEL